MSDFLLAELQDLCQRFGKCRDQMTVLQAMDRIVKHEQEITTLKAELDQLKKERDKLYEHLYRVTSPKNPSEED